MILVHVGGVRKFEDRPHFKRISTPAYRQQDTDDKDGLTPITRCALRPKRILPPTPTSYDDKNLDMFVTVRKRKDNNYMSKKF